MFTSDDFYPVKFPPIVQHFPFESYRPGQIQFLKLIGEHKRLMLSAPTGFGKSIIAFTGIWDWIKDGDHQLWLFSKTKAQLTSVFLRTLKKFYSAPPADQLTVLPLIAKRDLCPQPSDADCHHCPLKKRSRFLSRKTLSELLPLVTLSRCPDTFDGFRQLFSPYGCPSAIIKRLLPRTNIILLPQGFLESRVNRAKLVTIFKGSLKSGFPKSHRYTIIDEAHNFGPMIEASLSVNQLLHAQSIGAFPVVRSLLQLCSKPLGLVNRPSSAYSTHVTQIDHFLRQRGIRKHLSQQDLESLQAVRAFLIGEGQYWVHNEEGLVQLDPYPMDIFAFVHRYFDRIILMSATFRHLNFFKSYYGIRGLKKNPYRSFFVKKSRQQLNWAKESVQVCLRRIETHDER